MLPFKTIISINRQFRAPIYLQICSEMIRQIVAGVIPVGSRLPGGRTMGSLLGVSRKTVIQAYEELEAQGWVEIKPSSGVYISSIIPVTKKQVLGPELALSNAVVESSFALSQRLDFLDYYAEPKTRDIKYIIDTGYPDPRLAPTKALAQAYSRILNGKRHQKILNYSSTFNGHSDLRKELVDYLADTRGIRIGQNNIIITRGSLMAFTSIFQVLLSKGDKVVVGDISFQVANNIIKIAGGELITVPVDDKGLDVDAIEEVCQREAIRCVFVMPHHHHPTTVSLTAERRMKLLHLAKEYGFAIIEDDYDYDFHYSRSPILPMASADHHGSVVYVGSFSKTVAPGLRTGFVVAPENVIKDLSRLFRFMDCHGNTALEKAIASLFQEGIIKRHLKKSLNTYKLRRDRFCELLRTELGDNVNFDMPEGGLAVWVTFNKDVDLHKLREDACVRGLLISRTVFQNTEGQKMNAIRMGFASLDQEEMTAAVHVLRQCIDQV